MSNTAAPRPFPVVASNMIYAQGYKPTPADMAQMIARAEWNEAHGRDFPREVNVPVHGFGGDRIGTLTFVV